jgi:predicted 3-demethylubiquinone-9 3-methyltransferase (glyoxalase superfamily)
MKKISVCLWFDGQAEEAAEFYVSVFKDARILEVTRYGAASAAASGRKKGSVMTVSFELEGQRFLALNGGPQFKFSPAISLIVGCKSQKKIDRLWDALSADPKAEQCGWLKDKFGVSWQIVPADLSDLLTGKDERKTERATKALLGMKKLDAEVLRKALRKA